jgi:hypothetical protein
MSYTINKTDGSILATVADGQLDQLSSDLTLVGKNYSGFGESLNENFVKLLENFSSTSAPARPTKGQIWFDSSESKLKVYNGLGFVPVSSATIANLQPTTLGVGDLWFDNVNKQLFFYDGTNTILLGPSYTAGQGRSGLFVSNILDSLNQNRVITSLYDNGTLLGIFSKDAFTPKGAIGGFSGSIIPGFNAGTISGFKFNVTATNADALGNQPAASYLRRDTDNIMNGQLAITSNSGIAIGDAQQAQIYVDSGDITFLNDSENKNISVKVKRGAAVDSAIVINSVSQSLGLYPTNLTSEILIGGNLTVVGNVTIQGDTTTVNTSNLSIEDKNIELASGATTNADADGGGITLKGLTDHTIVWKNNGVSLPQLGTAWNVNDHINLVGSKYFAINGVEVISSTALGPNITSIPGVTSFGTQSKLVVGPVLPDDDNLGGPPLIPSGNNPTPYMRLDRNRISTLDSNRDIEIAPNGLGNIALKQVTGDRYIDQVEVGRPRITGMGDPLALQDAATKNYVDSTIGRRNIVFSMDTSDAISDYGIASWLTQVAPPEEYEEGTVARILCTSLSNSASTVNLNTYLGTSTTEFITPLTPGSTTPGGTSFGVNNVSFTAVTVPPPTFSVFRTVKVFQLQTGVWAVPV